VSDNATKKTILLQHNQIFWVPHANEECGEKRGKLKLNLLSISGEVVQDFHVATSS
jgi:hypothetical protein